MIMRIMVHDDIRAADVNTYRLFVIDVALACHTNCASAVYNL